MSRQPRRSASARPLRCRWILACAAVAFAAQPAAQPISTQAISEPAPAGVSSPFYSPDGQWVCFARTNLHCAPSNASAPAGLNHASLPPGANVVRAGFIPGSHDLLYTLLEDVSTPRLWAAQAGQPLSAIDLTPQWPDASVGWWIVNDAGDIVAHVEDGGTSALYRLRASEPAAPVTIGENIPNLGGLFFLSLQFTADHQALHALVHGRLWRIPIDGGPAVALSQLGAQAQETYDERGGYLYFRAAVTEGRLDLFRIPVGGGVPQMLNHGTTHAYSSRPFFSGDGAFACFFQGDTALDLACSDLRGASAQTLVLGQVAALQAGSPTGHHVIASDNRTVFGTCDQCSGSTKLYRARVDGSQPLAVLTGSSVAIGEVVDLPSVERVLYQVFVVNSPQRSWQSTTYDFTQPIDYPFSDAFVAHDPSSDRLAFLTDVNPLAGVELQLATIRSDGSEEALLTGGALATGVFGTTPSFDPGAILVHERALFFPGPAEGARLSRVGIDGSGTQVLATFPRSGNSTPSILGSTLSPSDPFGTASVVRDDDQYSVVISYSGPPAPLFRDGFEPVP